MSRDEALGDRFLNRRRKVHKVNSEITCTRIEHARSVTRGRQLHKRVPLADGDRFRNGHDLPDEPSSGFAGEGQGRFNFGVLRKVPGVRKVERATARIEAICALLSALESVRDLVNIAKVEVGRVNQHTSALFSGDFETPQRRLRERVFYCEPFVGVVAAGAERVIRRDEQYAWSTAIETHDRAVAKLTTIEPDVV